MRFWDASALVPLVVAEPLRDELLELFEQDPEIVAWWGSTVECTSAVARREREGALSANDATRALDRLRDLAVGWQEVLPSEPVRSTACRLLRVHPLRAADGLQLAAAIIAAEREPGTLDFVGLDDRLNDAASREGFRVVCPLAR
ncbi:type II toxin-antitoxin system VapC family toxin [Candidatus Binatia bacterium]|nr:type II toxin-antitoxin system VapC family toxin [Candidatus Binatia bacterium]